MKLLAADGLQVGPEALVAQVYLPGRRGSLQAGSRLPVISRSWACPGALQAYGAATGRWPDRALPWQALANARYTRGELAAAEIALRRALLLAPSAAAHNNLAHVLQKRGCPGAASTELVLAESMADTAALDAVLAPTRASIEQDNAPDHSGCAPATPALISNASP